MTKTLMERLEAEAEVCGAGCGCLMCEATARIRALRGELAAALGYMLNAKIDLDTGAPKRTALATIEGGIARVRTALANERTGE